MKVVQINAVNAILSTGRTCKELSDYLSNNGVECWTLYSFGEETEKSVKISYSLESKIHAVLSRLTGLQGYYSFFSTMNIINFLKRYKPDIVHLRNLHANYINYGMLLGFLKRENIATVVTLHDFWLMTGRCAYYTDEKCSKWIEGCHDCKQLNTNNESWFFDCSKKMWLDKKKSFLGLKKLAVVGVSKWVEEEAKKSFFRYTCAKITSIYNWIDSDIFHPCPGNELRDKLNIGDLYVILGVSTKWSKLKGLKTFLKLAELLSDDEIIVLVGEMPPEVDLPKGIISVGSTRNTVELAEYYSMADVFLQLSSQETFGKVVAESLACGTPVIGFDRTATSELISSECGVLLQGNADVNDVKEAVQKLKQEGKLKYKANCVKFAKDNFDRVRNCGKYLELYHELIIEK